MPAAEPVIYAASTVAMNDPTLRNSKAPTKTQTGAVDPLRSFEVDVRHIFPELMQWMTFDEATRSKKLDVIARKPTAHRDLNYIVWRETLAFQDGTGGSPDIALKALRRLFKMPDPKPKEEPKVA